MPLTVGSRVMCAAGDVSLGLKSTSASRWNIPESNLAWMFASASDNAERMFVQNKSDPSSLATKLLIIAPKATPIST